MFKKIPNNECYHRACLYSLFRQLSGLVVERRHTTLKVQGLNPGGEPKNFQNWLSAAEITLSTPWILLEFCHVLFLFFFFRPLTEFEVNSEKKKTKICEKGRTESQNRRRTFWKMTSRVIREWLAEYKVGSFISKNGEKTKHHVWNVQGLMNYQEPDETDGCIPQSCPQNTIWMAVLFCYQFISYLASVCKSFAEFLIDRKLISFNCSFMNNKY